jgi:hypothetical protein
MFTIEINGKGIAVVDADEDQARALAEDDDFLADLRSMTSNGEPLWNGSDALVIRIASDDEVEIVEATDDEDEDEEDEDEGVMIVFIPPIDEDDEGDVGDEEERRA